MKFLRNLTAVVLTVGVIIAAGMLWAHVSGPGTGPGSGNGSGNGPGPGIKIFQRLGHDRPGLIQVPSNGFDLADIHNLIHTILIEVVLAAVVITVSVIFLRRRRLRRTAAST